MTGTADPFPPAPLIENSIGENSGWPSFRFFSLKVRGMSIHGAPESTVISTSGFFFPTTSGKDTLTTSTCGKVASSPGFPVEIFCPQHWLLRRVLPRLRSRICHNCCRCRPYCALMRCISFFSAVCWLVSHVTELYAQRFSVHSVPSFVLQ